MEPELRFQGRIKSSHSWYTIVWKFWIDTYHLDGDYRCCEQYALSDYDRRSGHQHIDGGNPNYGGSFLRRLNAIIKNEHPDKQMIAEESSCWSKITVLKKEGLGLTIKWNMGVMNDILLTYEEDPIYREIWTNSRATFSFMYAFSENLLPFTWFSGAW